ncbi:MAG: glycosyltransferase [Candidatus Saccharimonadales bacterium]
MKILLVSESYWPNYDGGALFERRLVQDLNRRGLSTSVWAPGSKLSSYTEQDGDYTIYREKSLTFFANRGYRVSYWPFWHGREIIKQTQPDVIHIHMASFIGWSALFWARRYKIPVVATNHFMPENAYLNLTLLKLFKESFSRLCWRYLVWFHNKADFVTSPTPTAVALLQRHGLDQAAQAVTNGVDAETFRSGIDTAKVVKEFSLPQDRPLLLYLGRVDGEKRLDVLIEAMAHIIKQTPAHLVIAGRGKAADSLQRQTAELGLSEDITFTGFVAEADKAALYNAADSFIITSPAELQSIVTLEAMACGLPVIAADIAALRELARPGENGILLADLEPRVIASQVIDLLGNPQRLKSYGAASRQIVEREHSHEIMLNAYVAIYQKLVIQ